jgi:hypothetical protein
MEAEREFEVCYLSLTIQACQKMRRGRALEEDYFLKAY